MFEWKLPNDEKALTLFNQVLFTLLPNYNTNEVCLINYMDLVIFEPICQLLYPNMAGLTSEKGSVIYHCR